MTTVLVECERCGARVMAAPPAPARWVCDACLSAVQTHESMRLFAPVDVMPGQTGMEI